MYEHSKTQRFFLEGPILVTPKTASDARGLFSENWREDIFGQLVGQNISFKQDNLSLSHNKGTVRGLHGQKTPNAVGKLVQVLQGAVYDVAVDIRRESPTYGRYIGVKLDDHTRSQFWIPEGFLHGYETLEDDTLVFYKQSGYYAHDSEICIAWDDPALAIDWTVTREQAIVSDKDADAEGFTGFDSPF